ncbi:MAG TPA: hypothetical protein VG591_03520 [Burkholderiales bacterium]|jgi:hypothetical protein|nr:hypothetical protein [Burkholderiales bacterium]
MMARWIRLGAVEPYPFDCVYSRLAAAQAAGARPVLLWAQSQTQYLFALIAPRKLAPGRVTRWFSWALAPAIATYRQFGLAAYLEGDGISLHGRRIADSSVRSIGECAVVASSFLLQFPANCVTVPSRDLEDAFRIRLEAQHGWQFDHSWPTEPEKALAYAPSFS